MNKEQAITALEQGEKVRHVNFPARWHIEQDGQTYKWENGYTMPIETFWKNRTGDVWDKDWSVI